jgi:hypothetical protein
MDIEGDGGNKVGGWLMKTTHEEFFLLTVDITSFFHTTFGLRDSHSQTRL